MKRRMDLFAGIGVVLFISLALAVYKTPYFAIDLAVSKFVQSLNLSSINPLLAYLDHIGFYPNVQIWVGLIAVFLIFTKKRLEAFFFLLLALIDSGLFFSLSDLINRPRPSSDLIKVAWQIDAGSFPSGHVLMYTLLFGFLIYIISKQMKKGLFKTLLILFCVSIIFLTGLARIISGQHWPSDVFGAYLLGIVVLYWVVKIYEKTKKSKFKGLERFF